MTVDLDSYLPRKFRDLFRSNFSQIRNCPSLFHSIQSTQLNYPYILTYYWEEIESIQLYTWVCLEIGHQRMVKSSGSRFFSGHSGVTTFSDASKVIIHWSHYIHTIAPLYIVICMYIYIYIYIILYIIYYILYIILYITYYILHIIYYILYIIYYRLYTIYYILYYILYIIYYILYIIYYILYIIYNIMYI